MPWAKKKTSDKEPKKNLKDMQDKNYKAAVEEGAPAKKCSKCQMHVTVYKNGKYQCNCKEGPTYASTVADPVKPLPNYVDSKRFDTIEVKVDLTIDEKNEAGQELAHKREQYQQIEIEKKARMDAYKDQLSEIESQMSDLTRKVTLGYEYRKFRCVLHFDFIRKVRIYKDHETGITIDERPIQPDDYQMRMPI